jgi:peptidoglycan/xylan/chitin deacetylase (PgdA/CDA1 family)
MTRARALGLAGTALAAALTAACGQAGQAQAPAAPVPAAAERPNPLPGVTKTMEQLESEMFHVSAGRRLKPPAWPGNNRVAVALSFDVDNASMALSQGNLDYEVLSRGEYGAVDGLPRILRMLDRQQVPASFFIPAVSAALHPQMVPSILEKKVHEIGIHGWIHERLPTLNNEAEEQRLLDQSLELLTRQMGKRPVGYRAPSWKFSKFTMAQIQKAGFLYDSSLMASDDAYEILMNRKGTGVIELPIERIVDDAPYFGASDGSMPSPEHVLEVFQSEFDVAWDERGLYVLTMHPHIMGHRSRVAVLERLIVHMKQKGGVWFATHEDVAKHLKGMLTAGQTD